jgi:hypothetical protein
METLVCVDCGTKFMLSEGEKARFDLLIKTREGFAYPKRCKPCRAKRKAEGPPTMVARPLPAAPAAPPPPQPFKAIVPLPANGNGNGKGHDHGNGHEKDKEIQLVLATVDFDKLVRGEPIVYHGVKVLLADIGYDTMRSVIEEAERAGRTHNRAG